MRQWGEAGIFEREVAIYRRLQKLGVRVSFVSYGDSRDLEYGPRIPGIRILCNGWKLPARLYKLLLPVLHGWQLWRADCYKTNQTNGAEVALRAARMWRKPLVARCGYMWSEFVARRHGVDPDEVTRARDMEEKAFSAAQRVVVSTPTMAADIAQRVPAAAARTVVIPNYVDTEPFGPVSSPNRDLDVIFVGRLSPQKNIKALLTAIRPLDVRIALVGQGELGNELKREFQSLNGRILWVGTVPNEALPGYLNRAKLFVLPSLYEGHPKALIEAMACALPVVGADSPGIRELIRHGETGWLCQPDSSSIREAIEMLLAQPELRNRLGRNARRYVHEHFALDHVVGMEMSLFGSVVAS